VSQSRCERALICAGACKGQVAGVAKWQTHGT